MCLKPLYIFEPFSKDVSIIQMSTGAEGNIEK